MMWNKDEYTFYRCAPEKRNQNKENKIYDKRSGNIELIKAVKMISRADYKIWNNRNSIFRKDKKCLIKSKYANPLDIYKNSFLNYLFDNLDCLIIDKMTKTTYHNKNINIGGSRLRMKMAEEISNENYFNALKNYKERT